MNSIVTLHNKNHRYILTVLVIVSMNVQCVYILIYKLNVSKNDTYMEHMTRWVLYGHRTHYRHAIGHIAKLSSYK